MKKVLIILILVNVFSLFNLTTSAQAPDWTWAKSAGGTSDDGGRSIDLDSGGNAYVTGVFSSPEMMFNNISLTRVGFDNGIFVAKYDPDGNVVWAKGSKRRDNNKSYGYCYSTSLSVDPAGGCYVTGQFNGDSLIFGNTVLRNGEYATNLFIVKYGSDGDVVWAKSANGASSSGGISLSVDPQGNCFLTGEFSGQSITFDNIVLTGNLLEPGMYGGLFVVKYSPSGSVIWAKSFGTKFYDLCSSITVDEGGNSYITGYFDGPEITFGTTPLTTAAAYGGMYVVKYDPSGNVVWAKTATESGNGGALGSSICALSSGYFYVTGHFESESITFGTITLTNSHSTYFNVDAFLVKYDSDGNVIWAKNAGAPFLTGDRILDLDADGNAYLTGDVFVEKYNANGVLLYTVTQYGDKGYSISVSSSGDPYITGFFKDNIFYFGSIMLTSADASSSYGDLFVAKLGNNITGINSHDYTLCSVSIYPNPADDVLKILKTGVENDVMISIFNVQGQLLLSRYLEQDLSEIDISDFPQGIYLVKLITPKGVDTKKFIKE